MPWNGTSFPNEPKQTFFFHALLCFYVGGRSEGARERNKDEEGGEKICLPSSPVI